MRASSAEDGEVARGDVVAKPYSPPSNYRSARAGGIEPVATHKRARQESPARFSRGDARGAERRFNQEAWQPAGAVFTAPAPPRPWSPERRVDPYTGAPYVDFEDLKRQLNFVYSNMICLHHVVAREPYVGTLDCAMRILYDTMKKLP
jgi:hypothetical protein